MPIISPKNQFLKNKDAVKVHSDAVTNPAIRAALDVALAQVQYFHGTATDMGTAAANHFMLEGARKFRDTFLLLSESTPEAQFKEDPDNLK